MAVSPARAERRPPQPPAMAVSPARAGCVGDPQGLALLGPAEVDVVALVGDHLVLDRVHRVLPHCSGDTVSPS